MQRVNALHCRYLIVAVFCFTSLQLVAQHEIRLRPVSGTYAIVNATLIPSPGLKIEGGSIVIRDGLIEAVGTNVPVPKDAIVIQADSLFVYAGFIDGLSYVGVSRPQEQSMAKPEDPGNPPPVQAGITPQRKVVDFLNPEDQSLKEMRCAGFTAAHVVPFGNFMPGYGAVIQTGGETPADMVVRQDQSFYAKWSPNPGIYPSTIMGLMAVWRDMYRKALQTRAYTSTNLSSEAGLSRPSSGREIQALFPVIEKRAPVFFKAEKLLDIHHALALQKEFGFSMLIGNVREGWDAIEKIKSSGAGAFLSLNFPDLPDSSKDKVKSDESDSVTWSEERKNLEKRKNEFITKLVAQASVFQREGIVFGFSSLGVKPKKIHDQLVRAIDAGLGEQAALAALTTNAARLLGMSHLLGTLEKGKIANVVASRHSFFDKKGTVEFVFVDGIIYECEEPTPKKDPKKLTTLEGSWSFVADVPQGKTDLKAVFSKENDQYKGHISGGKLPERTELTGVSLKEKNLRFIYSVLVEGNNYEVVVEGKIEGNGFEGNLNVTGYGTFPMTGVKDPNED